MNSSGAMPRTGAEPHGLANVPEGHRPSAHQVAEPRRTLHAFPLDLFQSFNATFAHARIARRFANPSRIVPAALAFLATRPMDLDTHELIVLIACENKLNLRHDEDISQILLSDVEHPMSQSPARNDDPRLK